MIDLDREKLIVSADDFGLGEKENKSILQLVRLGKLNRVSVMVNGAISKEDAAELKDSEAKLDLHLTLGSTKEWEHKKNNKRNFIFRVSGFMIGYLSLKFKRLEVAAEWERQLKKFYAIFGQKPDGLNSHEYLHFFPPFFRIALRLAKKHQIPYIRFGQRRLRVGWNLSALAIDWLRIKNYRNYKKSLLASSDLLASYDWFWETKYLKEGLPNEMKTELVFHPEREKEYTFILENL